MGRRTRSPRRAALFDDTDRPTWLVVRSPWGSIIEQTPMPPGTDLVRLFITELLRYHDNGWRLNDFSSFSGEFYASKDGEITRQVWITLRDPSEPIDAQIARRR
jgi:hypothetical protein